MTEQLPEEFLEQVKTALENIYDFPALQRHPLATLHTSDGNQPAGHRLRRELITAIESLNPGEPVSVRSGPARVYNLLHMHYVGAMTLQETANDLGISLRQAYRDLRHGQESIAEVLHFNRRETVTPQAEPSLSQLSSIDAEVNRLDYTAEMINAVEVLQASCQAVEILAQRHHRQFKLQIDILNVSVERVAARQIFINLLSLSVREAKTEEINVHLHQETERVFLSITYDADKSTLEINRAVQQLINQIGWTVTLSSQDGQCEILLQITSKDTTILIIDDNAGLVDLMRRYLDDAAWHVLSANDGKIGLQLAKENQPDVIIMDLMMPGMDGWELLQYLRTADETQQIPVIICSVINDPDLAFSLGASQFIEKPVNKEKILFVLNELNL